MSSADHCKGHAEFRKSQWQLNIQCKAPIRYWFKVECRKTSLISVFLFKKWIVHKKSVETYSYQSVTWYRNMETEKKSSWNIAKWPVITIIISTRSLTRACALENNWPGLGVVFRPESDEFVEMMRTKNRPIASQVIEVVHDDGNEQIDDLPINQRDINYNSVAGAMRYSCGGLLWASCAVQR